MKLDIYRDNALSKILIVEDGKEISQISDSGSKFLSDLTFQRQVEPHELPTGIVQEEVVEAINKRGYYAAHQVVTVTETEIQD